MSATPDQIAQSIIASLNVSIPGLSCELGTPERKIIDAVSQAISTAYVNNYLTGSLLDIETKSGLELDQFVGIFGFGRLQGQPAEGVVTVELTTANNQDYEIQANTQFYTKNGLNGSNIPLYFAATQSVILSAGTFTAEVPVRCTTVGTAGNIAPDSVTFTGTMLGSASCTNLQSMTGGTDTETDDELRYRFENTLLRNVSGTSDWYKALCTQNKTVSRVEVYGPVNTYRTQILAPTPGTVSSPTGTPYTIPVQDSQGRSDVKYSWPGMESVFSKDSDGETFYNRPADYTLSSGVGAPQIAIPYRSAIKANDIIDVEFQYTAKCSRNDPVNGITNKVDIFVDGSSPVTVAEAVVVRGAAIDSTAADPYRLSDNSANMLWVGNFERSNGTTPTATTGATVGQKKGNRFTRLSSCPIISFPRSLTIGSNVFEMNTHYWLLRASTTNINSQTLRRGSPYEVMGIEWDDAAPGLDSQLILNYVYNQTPDVLTAVMSASKQICTDVMVHEADRRYIQPHLSVQYIRGYDVATVDAAINTRLKSFFDNLQFGARIEASVVALSVQQIIGVSSVWITRSSEVSGGSTAYGIKVYNNSNDINPNASPYESEFKLGNNQLAQFLSAVITRKPTP